MTLATHVYLLTEADPADVFMECRRLLGATEVHPFFDDDPDRWSDCRTLRNRAGIGLPALLYLRYREGEMLKPTNGCDEDCDNECSGDWHSPAHWIDVDFDTAYSYHDEQGRGCGALHASLVACLGNWLDDRGIHWAWKNEFTGEVHIGDKYECLFDLFKGGEDAERWVREIVRPAIARAFGGNIAPASTEEEA